jgi:predicted nucleic acid-binding Zn ribbon protein
MPGPPHRRPPCPICAQPVKRANRRCCSYTCNAIWRDRFEPGWRQKRYAGMRRGWTTNLTKWAARMREKLQGMDPIEAYKLGRKDERRRQYNRIHRNGGRKSRAYVWDAA